MAMTILQRAKILLHHKPEESHEDDGILEIIIDSVVSRILNYCNREELPAGLEFVVLDIALENFRTYKSGGQGAISGIKRGDTQIDYATTENYNLLTGAGGAEFSKNHIKQLNIFKKMRV